MVRGGEDRRAYRQRVARAYRPKSRAARASPGPAPRDGSARRPRLLGRFGVFRGIWHYLAQDPGSTLSAKFQMRGTLGDMKKTKKKHPGSSQRPDNKPPLGRQWISDVLAEFTLAARSAEPVAGVDSAAAAMNIRSYFGQGPRLYCLADLLHNVAGAQSTTEAFVALAQGTLCDPESDLWLVRQMHGKWSLEELHQWVGERDLRDLESRLEKARAVDQLVF